MDLQRNTDQTFTVQLTSAELGTVQAGLRETLEALDDWEFETRTGTSRASMRAMLDELRRAVGEAHDSPSPLGAVGRSRTLTVHTALSPEELHEVAAQSLPHYGFRLGESEPQGARYVVGFIDGGPHAKFWFYDDEPNVVHAQFQETTGDSGTPGQGERSHHEMDRLEAFVSTLGQQSAEP